MPVERGKGYVVVQLSPVQEACYNDPGEAGTEYRAHLQSLAPMPDALVLVGSDGLLGFRSGYARPRYEVKRAQ